MCFEEVSTCCDAFIMRYVGVERRDVLSDKNGINGQLSELLEFVKEVCSVFHEGLCSLYQIFEVIVYKLKDTFCRVRVSRNNGASGILLFMYFG